MKKIKLLITAILLLSLTATFSQETQCSNGIDDDGDGLVDCFDPDCSSQLSSCTETTGFLESASGCTVEIPKADTFELAEEWRTENIMYDSRIPLVGDVDNDGLTEVVITNLGNTYIIDGVSGKVKNTLATGAIRFGTMSMADVDKDGFAEFFFADAGTSLITRVDYNGTTSFTSTSTFTTGGASDNIAFADINQDGETEVIYGGSILTHELEEILAFEVLDDDFNNAGKSFTVAVDILPSTFCANCDGMEIVAGNKVYTIDIANKEAIEQVSLNATGNFNFGYSAVADMNGNGALDIIVADNTNNKIYVWNPITNTLLSDPFTFEAFDLASSGRSQDNMGRPNIGDFDNDGLPEIGVATQLGVYRVLEPNASNELAVLAEIGVTDNSSGFTGSSIFDFEGDGINEIVYRDEENLYVYRLENGQLETVGSTPCGSGTRHEYPVVVDVDNDDATEILCACSSPSRQQAVIISVSASNTDWVRARSVWNQHSYFNVNVNDDLTIPRFQSQHHLFENGALNNFLVQSTYVDPSTGEPTSQGREMAMGNVVEVSGLCDEDNIIYKYEIINNGNLKIPASTPINYSYKFHDGSFDQPDGGDIVSFIRTVDEVIEVGGSIVQVDTVDLRGVPFDVRIKLNTRDPLASAGNPSLFVYKECVSDVAPVTEAYLNNFLNIEGLDTCKELIALNDTITITSNEVVEWTSILDNDKINFSANDFDGYTRNFKRYIDTLVANALSNATPSATVSAISSDFTIDEGIASFTYNPLEFVSPDTVLVDSFQYKICHSTIPDLCDSAWVFIKYEYQSEVPQGLNAADNGTFEIPNFNVNFFPDNELKIFNRWGTLVYKASPYNNDWNGTNNNGEELPVGTYFFVLDRGKQGFKVETGFVYVNR